MLAPVPLLGPGARDGDPRRGRRRRRWRRSPSGEVRPVWSRRGRRATWRPTGPSTRAGRGAARGADDRAVDGDSVTLTGRAAYVPDAPGADLLVVVGVDGEPVAVVDAGAAGVTVEQVVRYDATRSLGARDARRRARAAARRRRRASLADAWYVAQALIAAESLGTVQTTLEMSVAVRQGAVHVRARDRLLPGDQARAHRGAAAAGERPLAAVLRRAGRATTSPTSSRSRRAPRASAAGARARLRRAVEHQRARRHRRDVGARRTAVLPPRPADPPAASAGTATRPIAWPSGFSQPE